MKIEEILQDEKQSHGLMKKCMLMVLFVVVVVYAVFHLDGILALIESGLSILSPFLAGIVIAFIINILVKVFEERVFAPLNRKYTKRWPKVRRGICILIAALLIFALLVFVIFLIVPELVRSITTLGSSAPAYFSKFQAWALNTITGLNLSDEAMLEVQNAIKTLNWSKIIDGVTGFATGLVGSLLSVTMSITSGIVTFFMSLIFSIYMLFSKEKLIHNLKRVLYAFLPQNVAKKTIEIGTLSNRIFANFVTGQCTEALIIGVLCFLGMSIINQFIDMPYALLISTVVAVTSVIPIFGAYIGAIFGALILLLIHPFSAVVFVLFIIVLQNLEGNLIYPRVVGSSVGLPGIWVMFAICVFGDLFGFLGVLLGVPTCSVLYTLLRSSTKRKLEKKNISDREVEANQLGLPPTPPVTKLEKEPIQPLEKKS